MTLTRSNGDVLFSDQELMCKQTGVVKLADGFGPALVELRLAYDHPMHVTSCCRSRAHNERIVGHPRSLHIFNGDAHISGTAAIDIAWPNEPELRWKLLHLAQDLNWSFGIKKTKYGAIIHLDQRVLANLVPTPFAY